MRVGELESEIEALSTTGARRQTCAFASGWIAASRSTTCCAETFATVREAGKRVLEMRHFDTQMIGGR